MNTTTAEAVITILRSLFSRMGLPDKIVSDNGPPFSSEEFNNYLRINDIRHIFTPPYHPVSNGAAENSVKAALKKALLEKRNIDEFLPQFLLHYRNSAHATTNVSPAEKIFGRKLKSRLDLVGSNFKDVIDTNVLTKLNPKLKTKNIQVGDNVQFKNFSNNVEGKWIPGVVTNKRDDKVFEVKTDDNQEVVRHANQIMKPSHSCIPNIAPISEIVKSNERSCGDL